MTTRSLAVLVLSLVLGTILMVGWYLEGEHSAAAAERAPDAWPRLESLRGEEGGGEQPRLQHLWRSYPSAAATRRGRGSWGTATSRRAAPSMLSGTPGDRGRGRGAALGTPPAMTGGARAEEAMAFEPRMTD